MRRRRKKKNPASTYLLIGAGVLVVGGVAFFLYERSASAALPASTGTQPASSPNNTPIPAAQVAAGATVGLSASLCAQMRNGQAPTSQDDLDACSRLGL